MPGILKRFRSAREYLDTLGFDSLDLDILRRFGFDIPDEQTFTHYYEDFAIGVRQIGELQRDYNDLKNRLKHGKAVLSNGAKEITFLKWNGGAAPAGWDRTHIETTLRQIEVAVKQTAKIYLRSLDFLHSFMMHYHAAHTCRNSKGLLLNVTDGVCEKSARLVSTLRD